MFNIGCWSIFANTPIWIFGLQVVWFGLGHPRRTGRSLEGKSATQVTGQALTVSTGSTLIPPLQSPWSSVTQGPFISWFLTLCSSCCSRFPPSLSTDQSFSSRSQSHPACCAPTHGWRHMDHPHRISWCQASKSLLFHIAHVSCCPSPHVPLSGL